MAGLASSGVDVLRLGVIPTPGVAYLTGALDADFGVVLSASHNPAADNGIKFFGRGGVKLSDETEDEIEAVMNGGVRQAAGSPVFGRVTDAYSAHETYLDHLLATLPSADGTAAAARAAGCRGLRAWRRVQHRAARAAPGGRRGDRDRRRA